MTDSSPRARLAKAETLAGVIDAPQVDHVESRVIGPVLPAARPWAITEVRVMTVCVGDMCTTLEPYCPADLR